MNRKITFTLFAICIILMNPIWAMERVFDVVTLKNGKGVIKGIISEQVPGETIKIIPSSAWIKIDFENIVATPTTKSIKQDSTALVLDVVKLKNGISIEGTIMEQSPGKWLTIKTENLLPQTYLYEDIERFGKETEDANMDIFKAYGVLDVLYLKDGVVVKGIIIDQLLGESVKVKTAVGIMVYNISEVIKTGKEAYDIKRDIFKQSAFLDVVMLKNNSTIKGIIIEQIPGQSLRIFTAGNSSFVQAMSDVNKLCKEKNTLREELNPDTIIKKIVEPEYIGDCLWIKSADSVNVVEKRGFVSGTKNKKLLLIDGTDKSTTRFSVGQDISFRVKVANNNMDPKSQIYIFKISTDKGSKKRIIDSNSHLFLSPQADRLRIPVYPQYSATKTGISSFEIKIKLNDPGEYAIYVAGCEKSFSFFGVDAIKLARNEANNHRNR